MNSKPSFLKKTTCLIAALLMFASTAFATPTSLSVITLVQNNVAVTAGQLAFTFTACDNTNGNSFPFTGREVLVVQNTGGSTGTFTLTSVPDSLGRSDSSLTAYSVAASAFAVVQLKFTSGWLQSNGTALLACSAASMKYAVLLTN